MTVFEFYELVLHKNNSWATFNGDTKSSIIIPTGKHIRKGIFGCNVGTFLFIIFV